MKTELVPIEEILQPIRLVVAAANPSGLNGIVSMIEQFEGFEVTASALDGEECLQRLEALEADVLLTEISLPKISGVKIAEYLSINRPEIATVILADQNSLGFFRTAMLAGAMDFLTVPLPAEELAYSIQRVHQLKGERRRHAEEPSPRQSTDRRVLLGKNGATLTVCGGKGGTGKSTVAALVASYLAGRTDASIALVDFDLQFGDLSVLFDLQPKKSLLDLLPMIEEVDSNVIKSACTRSNATLDLFLSSPHVEKSDLLKPDHTVKLLEVFRETYDLVVNNTGPRLTGTHLDLFEASDIVLVVVNQDIPSLKAAAQLLNVYNRLGLSTEGFAVVVNKYDPKSLVTLDKIRDGLESPIYASIPSLSPDEIVALHAGAVSIDNLTLHTRKAVGELADAICRKVGLEPPARVEAGRRPRWTRFSKG